MAQVKKRAKMEEIRRNVSRQRELRALITRQCEENAHAQEESARVQEAAASDIREVREKTDRHVERLEHGFDEDTGKITIEKP